MRLRGVVILALTTTACAAVIGLGDYDVEPESSDAGFGNEAGVSTSSSSSGASPNEAGGGADVGAFDATTSDARPGDADSGTTDAARDAKADADSGPVPTEAGSDASPPNRSGIQCSSTTNCDGTPPCCHTGSNNFECLSRASCTGPANGAVFECDDDADCKKDGAVICCVDVGADGKPNASFCSSTTCNGAAHACVSNAECVSWGGGLQCLPPKQALTNGLPLLNICR